jgi:hypothetical protein
VENSCRSKMVTRSPNVIIAEGARVRRIGRAL